MNPSVNEERPLAMRVLREPHFLQTFAGKRDLAIRRRPFGSIFDDVTLRAVTKKIARLAKKIQDLDPYHFVFQFCLLLFDVLKGVDLVTDRWR